MGIFDKVKNLANKNKDKIADGVDKATDAIDAKTGGKHTDHLQKVDDAADKYAGRPTTGADPARPAGTTPEPAPVAEPDPGRPQT